MEKDLVDYAYLSDNSRYADLFNGVLFGGEEVLVAEKLKGEDAKLVISSAGKKKGRYRDVIRKYERDVGYAVLGVENQENVSYTMPFRVMEYEIGEYGRQISEKEKKHRKKKDVTGAEYLSQFQKNDRLNPCVTLVLFWGEHWDGPEELLDMVNLEAIPEPLRPYVNNRMYLVKVREFGNTDVFKTDLKLVFDFMKQTKEPEGMRGLLLGNEAYKSVSKDAYEVMRVHTNLKELDRFWEESTSEEEVDMCYAIRMIIKEEREKGREEGRAQGLEQGILLHAYQMVARGRETVAEALEDIELNLTESEFLEGLQAAGYTMP